MVNSEHSFVIDATFLLDASHKAFLGAPIFLVDGKDHTFYLPTVDFHLQKLDPGTVLSALKKMLEGKIKVVGHNLKYDYLLLRRYGIRINHFYFDTMLATHNCFGDWDDSAIQRSPPMGAK